MSPENHDVNATSSAATTPPTISVADQSGSRARGEHEGIARSVIANWAGQSIVVVSGFILPRFVKDELGAEQLGVWDLGWSMVAYLMLLNAGIASSVNRHVARARAMADWAMLSRDASCCACVFLVTSLIAVVVTALLAGLLPGWLPVSFAPYLDEVRWVVACLGLMAACGLAVAVFNGVITGYMRYDLVVYIESGAHALAFAVTLIALYLGYGLRVMGVTFLAAKLIECTAKVIAAYSICPQLQLSPRLMTRSGIWRMTVFGGKFFVHQMSRITLYQGNALLVALFLGPASVAVYSRAMALVQYSDKVLFEFGRVLIPSASALQTQNDDAALNRLILLGMRYSLLIALPSLLVLTIVGDSLMRVWMGAEFSELPLLTILAIGHVATLSQTGPFYVLLGLNRHGVPALCMGIAAVVSISISALCVGLLKSDVTAVAWSVGGSMTLVHLLVMPWAISRASGLSVRRYLLDPLPGTLAAVAPFTLVLMLSRWLIAPHDLFILLVTALAGGLVLFVSYWHLVLPPDLKHRMGREFRRCFPTTASSVP